MAPIDEQASALEPGRCADCTGVRNDTAGIRDDLGILRTGQVEIERNVDTIRLTVRVLRQTDLPVIRGGMDIVRDHLTHLRAGQTEIRELLADIVRRLDARSTHGQAHTSTEGGH
ncbi:hypothetical protein [Herbidospora sp. RD11066]